MVEGGGVQISGLQKKSLLYVDAETTAKAKESGLGLFEVAENALKEAVRRLEGMKSEKLPRRYMLWGKWRKVQGDSSSASSGDVSRKTPFFCLKRASRRARANSI